MRIASVFAVLCLSQAALVAQNFVTNGDFSAGLTGWTETGYSHAPGIETFDVTGLGASQCYGAGHGGQVTPAPYPPNSIKQQIFAVPGVPYELSVDICVLQAGAGSNADAGTFYVEIGGVEVARVTFGGYSSLEFARGRLTKRFVLTTGGPNVDFEVFMHRRFLGTATTPRVRIDNISLSFAPGPVFVWQGTRKLTTTRTVGAEGEPSAPFAFLLSGGRTSGLQVPPLQGTFFLDPTSLANFFGGVFDTQGSFGFPLTVPNDPALTAVVLHTQGAHLINGVLQLGADQALQFQ
jgi:hypothetical protein